VIVSYVQTNNS